MNNFKRGFSLIELLLALSIFAVVVVCVYGTFWAGMNLSNRSNEEQKVYHQMRLALELMSVDLENAVPYDFTNSYPDKRAFEGSEQAIVFLAASPEGLKAIRYSLEPADEGRIHRVVVGKTQTRNVATVADYREEGIKLSRLVREERDFSDYVNGARGAGPGAETIAVDIKENSLKFAFGYLPEGKDKADDRYEWHAQWPHPYLPVMVRVQMDFFVAGRQARTISVHKDVLIPHGSWGKPENT